MADVQPNALPLVSTTATTDVFIKQNGSTSVVEQVAASNMIPPNSITGASMAGTYKVTRQNDTTNVTESTARILTGWGVMTTGVSTLSFIEGVTFNTAFTSPPIVIVTFGGDQASGTTSYGSGGDTIQGSVTSKAVGITTTGFTVRLISTGTSWPSGASVYYQWIAVGI